MASKTKKGTKVSIRAREASTGRIARQKGKKKSLSTLKKKLDAVFSKWIRRKHSKNGCCVCFTCGKIKPIENIQCGHFVSRQYLATRWDERNCRPQCWGCNGYGKGQTLAFEEHLIKDIGKHAVEELKRARHRIVKLDRGFYEANIEVYQELLKKL